MQRPPRRDLCLDARAIWQAGVDAVQPARLIGNAMQLRGDVLTIIDRDFRIGNLGRIAIVGGGKAGAAMAVAVEAILGPDLVDRKVTGWVNVPADCVCRTRKITLHGARPAGVNEPTAEGVLGSQKILEIVSNLTADDLCLVLISGGGSALLPAPAARLTLADKQAVTRFLMQSGATISELNTVRKQLSQIKGGKLAQACRAGQMLTLIISDVVGDPLDVIASGPTVPDTSTPSQALTVLRKFAAKPPEVPLAVFNVLECAARQRTTQETTGETGDSPAVTAIVEKRAVEHHIIGNNAVALSAAAATAAELGYRVQSLGSANQGEASSVGCDLAERCLALRNERPAESGPVCLLSGGEPVVHLAKTDRPRKGGRNQQLVLAALDRLCADGMSGMVILSGGTDGEDGQPMQQEPAPTSA
jgi:hydroxypyruvate reductase